MAIRVAPLRIAVADPRWRGLELMAHQARSLELVGEPRVLIEAPTGGGKTWAGAAPLVDAAVTTGSGAIFAYPTNALADDQVGALGGMIRRAGYTPATVQADGSADKPGADILLWRVHAGALDEVQGRLRARSRGQALSRILERLPAKPLWLVTNPDTLYLLFTARYSLSPQIWARLAANDSLVLDEFHLYRGPALVRALALVELARELIGVERVRLLSATLPPAVRSLLTEQLGFTPITAEPTADGRVVQHSIELSSEAAQGVDATERICRDIEIQLPHLRAERTPGYVPLLVLRQSVMSTIALEDQLVGRGIESTEIGVYRGLMARAVRSVENKSVVLGTSALELGVDFRTRRLTFEALSSASFAQRLGRLGRHESGTALFLTDARAASALEALGDVDRPSLFDAVCSLLPADDDLADFARSPFAHAVATAAFEALMARGDEMGAPPQFRCAVDAARQRLFDSLGLSVPPSPAQMSRHARHALLSCVGFRGGEGTVEVFDVREQRRRGDPSLARYDVDLVTFFRRANWTGTPGKSPVIVGYVRPRKLSLSLSMATAGVGIHAPKPDQIELRVEGAATAWESLIRARPHIVGVFPDALRGALSWREDVFESDDGRVALLDDDALVAGFLYSRRSDASLPRGPSMTYEQRNGGLRGGNQSGVP